MDENEEIQFGVKRKKIRGWLTFFLVVGVGLGALVSTFFIITDFSFDDYLIPYGLVGSIISFFLAMFDIFLIPVLAAYLIYSFYSFKPNAVFLGKFYLVMVVFLNSFSLITGQYDTIGFGGLSSIAKGLIWSVIWLSYLFVSDQVKELFPPESRRIFKRDKYLLGIIVTMFLLSFLNGMLA